MNHSKTKLPPIDFHDWTCNNQLDVNKNIKCSQYNHKQSRYCVKCGKHRYTQEQKESSSSFTSFLPSPLLVWRCLLCAGNNLVYEGERCKFCKALRPLPDTPYHTWVPRKGTAEKICSRCDYIYRGSSCSRCGYN